MAGIMKARKKPLETIPAEELGVPLEPRVEVIRYRSGDTRRAGERLTSLDEFAERIAQAAGIGG
jgi:electron transfer flavoprotein beta subunit